MVSYAIELAFRQGRREERTAANSVIVIGDCSLSDSVRRILDNGPKHSFESAVQSHQLLAMARQAACRTDVRERDRATSDAVNCFLSRAGSQLSKKPPFKYVVDTLKKRSLAILQADKEGGFVVMDKGKLNEKAIAAVEKKIQILQF
ncbi:hypothetical protein MTO96_015271 [Rhipicephalus appendiculatus]